MQQGTKTVDHKTRARCVDRLVPSSGSVCITRLADRGFGNERLYRLLEGLGSDDVMRFRNQILVGERGKQKPAAEWPAPTGWAKKLAGAYVTADRTEIGAVVVVRGRRMKEASCLATSLRELTAAEASRRCAKHASGAS